MLRALAASAACLAAALLAPAPAAADLLDDILARGEIRIAVRDDAPPLSYLGEDGVHQGYSVAICRVLADRLAGQLGRPGLGRVLVPVTAENRFEAVAEGRADLLCGAASVTLSRREIVDFSIPTFVDGAAVMTREDGPQSIEALAGERIGVRAGTTTEESLRLTLSARGIEAEIVAIESHPDGVADLRAGRLDAYIADQSILYGLAAVAGTDGLRTSENTLTLEPHALAMPRGETRMRLEVDRALSRMWRDGTMNRVFDEAFAPAQPGEALRALSALAPILE